MELRGLEDRKYAVVNYVDGTSLGSVSGHDAHVTVDFEKHLLLEVRPQ